MKECCDTCMFKEMPANQEPCSICDEPDLAEYVPAEEELEEMLEIQSELLEPVVELVIDVRDALNEFLSKLGME